MAWIRYRHGNRTQYYHRSVSSSVSAETNVRDDDGSKNLAVRLLNLANQTADTRDSQFVCSIRDWFSQKGYLTASQFSNFERIEKKLAAPTSDPIWEKEWGGLPRQKFAIAIRYYRAMRQYYQSIVVAYDKNPDTYRPSRELYERMTGNKFVGGAIREGLAPAKFKVGDLVEVLLTADKTGLKNKWKSQSAQCALNCSLSPIEAVLSLWTTALNGYEYVPYSPTNLYIVLTVNEYGPFIGHKGSKIYTLQPVSVNKNIPASYITCIPIACEECNLKGV